MAEASRTLIFQHMTRSWEQYIHMAMFTAAAAVIVALIVWWRSGLPPMAAGGSLSWESKFPAAQRAGMLRTRPRA